MQIALDHIACYIDDGHLTFKHSNKAPVSKWAAFLKRYEDYVNERIGGDEFVIQHSINVATNIVDGASDDDEVAVVALLHDFREDYNTSAKDLVAILGDYANLRVIWALNLLTHRKKGPKAQTYTEYIERILNSGNQLAITVKIGDILDHFRPVDTEHFPKHKFGTYLFALELLYIVRWNHEHQNDFDHHNEDYASIPTLELDNAWEHELEYVK